MSEDDGVFMEAQPDIVTMNNIATIFFIYLYAPLET